MATTMNKMSIKPQKILIIRLSSFGDIIQTLPAVDALQSLNYEVHYLTKPEFKHCVESSVSISQIHYWPTKESWSKQLTFLKMLFRSQNFNIIYDAHNNQRTLFLRLFTFFTRLKNKSLWITRSKNRFKRLLFFNFKIRSVFKTPIIAAQSFIDPLKKIFPSLKLEKDLIEQESKTSAPSHYVKNFKNKTLPILIPDSFVILAPSAAWPLKRWPIDYYQKIINTFSEINFVIIGGPEDHFAMDLKGQNVTNLVSKLNWFQTGQIISKCKSLIADTGVLHWADYMGISTIGILGPTAFGTPFRPSTKIMNLNLPCSPCSKEGNSVCKIKETQKCLKDLTPETIGLELRLILKNGNLNVGL
jgi:ADP-heptose:LPS heptosyltransferase